MASRNILQFARNNVPQLSGFVRNSSSVPDHTLALISGTLEGAGRKVSIFSPSRVAGQQGIANTGYYKLQFEAPVMWENPLIGWTSAADPYANLADSASGLKWKTVEEAKKFCAQNGWEVTEVREAKEMLPDHPATIKGKVRGMPKAYADNFSHKRKGIPVYDK
mmetsp:Transcript_1558/g.2228  ORF Transcript_1558/g.2228 Transcript_1558/m.2228 type:complete len:164 (+) Transcript_1558:107-598(+)|eukprot:CAMPEP_0196580422 /NCGR_PEP_ID=MMETSP1081-20130531/28619_1 /TAXON_ID=36882 /ORGANISM="Pyramimonas amylifera, Strain CCMP720" /LENGTH=163 /DNA_ID=CAMNT_0041900283 /DNA_START=98 /DNA_END=589 /DNA_ORIENTATION=-